MNTNAPDRMSMRIWLRRWLIFGAVSVLFGFIRSLAEAD